MRFALTGCLILGFGSAWGQVGTITIDAGQRGPDVPKGLYGVFLEEINHAGEGGLYAELLQNRGFEDADIPPSCKVEHGQLVPPRTPHFWSMAPSDYMMPWDVTSPYPGWSLLTDSSEATISLVADKPLNANKPHALAVDIRRAPAEIANAGFWGVPIKSGEAYKVRVWAEAGGGFDGPISAKLVSEAGKQLAKVVLGKPAHGRYGLITGRLVASGTDPKGRFVLEFGSKGKVWIAYASLFPERTFMNRPNGLRLDLAKMVADLKPGFVRFPGGCYVEGLTVQTRPQWQQTLGPVEQRTPTYSPWGYWNTNGFGFHEWLQFCEDIHAQPLYVFNVGVSCAFRSGTFLPDDQLPGLIQNTLNAIEYANGPVTSRWGALRAKNGHPKPFGMKYVEIGNEQQGPRYGARVAMFYKAIKAKYPDVNVILSSWISGIDHAAIAAAGRIDFVDEHAYTQLNSSIWNFDSFATYPRDVPWKLYIGEFACNGGVGQGNLAAALNDAAYMMSMEKNSDLVKMGSYAPLFENVNSSQWEVNMIHFDAARSFGRATYYACKMFADNVPTYNVGAEVNLQRGGEPPVQGPIGLGTFATEAEFKDLRLLVDGKPALANDFTKQAEGWHGARAGAWQVDQGAYGQRTKLDGEECFSFFGDGYHDIDLSVKARKIAGDEGFLLSIGSIDGMRVQVNYGGWGNSIHALQIDSGSAVASSRGSIETGRWCDLRVVTHGRSVQAFLDGKSVLKKDLPTSRTVLAIAGMDTAHGELVVKVVSTRNQPTPLALDLKGFAALARKATAAVLTSSDETGENSFEAPTRIVPVVSEVAVPSNRFQYVFAPHSLTILRIKTLLKQP